MKKKEQRFSQTKFLYWMEESLLSGFRWQLFDWVISHAASYNEIRHGLSKPFLLKLAASNTKVHILA